MMKDLQAAIGYTFQDPSLLIEAMTHSSYAHEQHKKMKYNERLEFLGDAVLSIVVSDYIYRHCPDLPEGELTKLRASLVCEKSLFDFAKTIDLGSYLLLSNGERRNGGAKRPSIVADAFEALIAAIYLDGGMEPAREHILRFIVPEIENHKHHSFKDYKTVLQEIIQKNPGERLEYRLVGSTGPDHDKTFLVEVVIKDEVFGPGEGKNKKTAEQHAAHIAYEEFKKRDSE